MRLGSILIAMIILLSCSSEKPSDNEKRGIIDRAIAEEPSANPSVYKEIRAFIYHRFGDNRFPTTNTSLSQFEAHLNYLKTHDYQVLTLSEAIEYLDNDGRPSRKTALITIDDAFSTVYDKGWPILKKYDMPATLFINTESIGGGDYMNWEEVKEMHQGGIEIGNHSHSHAYFMDKPKEVRYTFFEDEIEQCQAIIRQKLNFETKVFAYPYGEFDPQMKTAIKNFGFKAAMAQNSGVITSATDRFQLPRFPMSENYASLPDFKLKANAHAFKVIRAEPESFVLPSNESTPELRLVIQNHGFQNGVINCFIQGADCKLTKEIKEENELVLSVSSKASISNRRRTLYTITAPDSLGDYFWYSHLWINPN